MGDMADDLNEQEIDYLMLHQTGQCGEYGPCKYCEEENGNEDDGM